MAQEAPVRTELAEPLTRGRFTSVAQDLLVYGDGSIPRWAAQGVTWNPWPCRGLLQIGPNDLCAANPEDYTDWGYLCEPAVTQEAFKIVDVFGKQALSGWVGPTSIGDQIEDFISARFNLMKSYYIAREFAMGTQMTRTLRNMASAPTGHAFGAGVPVKRAIAELADELARRLKGGKGVIHMPPSAVEFAGVKEEDEEVFRTVHGHLVIADAGYVDMREPTGGGATAADAEAWIYATGPVYYATTQPQLLSGTDISRNRQRSFIEANAVAITDPCAVTAVLATLA